MARKLALFGVVGALVVSGFYGCSSDSSGTSGPEPDATAPDVAQGGDDQAAPPNDAGVDAPHDAANDSACPQGKVIADAGETCTGFGAGDPCTAACGLYGYVCFNGGPPGFTGCLQVSASALGETYCCPENKCVAEPDQDSHCSGASGKPHLYQCPPDGTDGGSAAPAASCAAAPSPGGPYKYYCCP